jgi:phage gp46-like protein
MNLLLQDNGDGGELVLEAGDLKSDETLLTALYISLFSGDCFYNIYEEHESDGEFEEALSQPITVNNLKATENAAKKATKWMIDEGLADSIEASARGNLEEKQNIDITITEPSGISKTFGIIWQNERTVLKAR